MGDVLIRQQGRVGRITLNRPEALNALTLAMIRTIDAALRHWARDDTIAMLVIDAAGTRAFCAGGDLTQFHDSGADPEAGRAFWRQEYRLNARLFHFPKPVATFMQGYAMGGGVGIGCHGSHRVVGAGTRISLPECPIGLVPDVGSTLLLAQAPGRLGEYLGLTGDRMEAADALHGGFADYHIPEGAWPALIDALCASGDWSLIDAAHVPPGQGRLAVWQPAIDATFGGESLGDIYRGLIYRGQPAAQTPAIAHALALMARNAPLAMACTVEFIHRVRMRPTIETALGLEYRYAHRALAQGDFPEGIRAALIDRDRAPRWAHPDWTHLPARDVLAMTLPLGPDALQLEDEG